jgi:hypothetical protein
MQTTIQPDIKRHRLFDKKIPTVPDDPATRDKWPFGSNNSLNTNHRRGLIPVSFCLLHNIFYILYEFYIYLHYNLSFIL